jgi:hypothetical protein
MLTLININKAINDRINLIKSNTDYSNVKIVAEDVSEPIIRPSLKVELDNSSNGKYNSLIRERLLSYKIYFFAQDSKKYKFDNIKMQEILENGFLEALELSESFFVEVENFESIVVDTVLICSYDINLIEEMPDTDNSELMEDLNLNIMEE